MNRDDIIRMAKEAGAFLEPVTESDAACLERFAALVAAAEREACAKVCEDEAVKQFDNMDIPLTIAADLIRARGTQ